VDRFRHLERVQFTTVWRIETHAFTEAVHCVGKNRFLEDGSGTLMKAVASSRSTQSRSGMPQLLAGPVGRGFLSRRWTEPAAGERGFVSIWSRARKVVPMTLNINWRRLTLSKTIMDVGAIPVNMISNYRQMILSDLLKLLFIKK